MMSAHSLFLIIIFALAGGAFAFYRIRPRLFMRTLRRIDEWSGLIIITAGLTVLICGCLGFASVGKDGPAKKYAANHTNKDAAQTSGNSNPNNLETGAPIPLTMGDAGSEEQDEKTEQGTSLAGAIYETFQIFAFNIEHTELERSLLLRLAMIAAILLATMVASKGIAILFHKSYEDMGLRFKSMHVVVCGLGRIGRQLLADLEAMKSEFQIVVIEPDEDNKNIEWAREMGAVVLIGDATRAEMLEAARVQRAREVFVVTGSDECNIESVIEIRDIIARKGRYGRFAWLTLGPLKNWRFLDYVRKKLPKLCCHVHILDKDLAEIVRDKSIQLERLRSQGKGNEDKENELIDVEIFNALERTARRLLEDISATVLRKAKAENDDGETLPTSPPQVLHYFMFGFGEFGQTLALKLAELSHFPSCTRTRMSVFDYEIARTAAVFTSRYPAFCANAPEEKSWVFDPEADDWEYKNCPADDDSKPKRKSPGIDYVCNARFVEYLDIADDTMLRQMKQVCEAANIQPVILVCFEDDRENFARAERLRAKLNSQDLDWPIFVWIPRQRELSQLLSEHRQHAQSKATDSCDLIPFGQCYGSVSYTEINDSWMDWLARHIHLVWMQPKDDHWTDSVGKLQNALQDEDGLSTRRSIDWEELDKTAKLVWEGRTEWERASNRSCAVHAVLKAAALGMRITGYTTKPAAQAPELGISPEVDEQLRKMEHYRWVAERLLAGWRYAEQRSDLRKTRWQITPWSQLDSPPQSVWDEAAAEGSKLNEKMKDEVIVRLLGSVVSIGVLIPKHQPQSRT